MKKNVFVKTNEQSQAGLDYAMARKRRMKSNVSIMSYKLPMTCKAMMMTVLFCMLTLSALGQNTLESGVYYIQNLASGTYLSSGANWGTRAVLSKHGVDFNVTRNSDGTYVLKTDIQGVGKALRPSDGYMDQSGNWTVTPLADGTFALYNGTNYFGYVPTNEHPWIPRLDTYTDTSSPNTHWRFRSREEMLASLKTATKENPVDATFLISAPDFLIGDHRIKTNKVWGPDVTDTGGLTSGDVYVRNGSNGEVFNKAAFDVFQQLYDLPLGTYSLSVQAFYRYGGIAEAATARNNGTEEVLPVLYAGNKTARVHSIFSYRKGSATGGWAVTSTAGYIPDNQSNAADCFDSGEDIYLTTIKNITVGDGQLRIGIRKDNKTVAYDWCCFDNFTLLYYGVDVDALKSQVLQALKDYEALNTDGDQTFAEALADIRQKVENTTDTDVLTGAYREMETAYSIWKTKEAVVDTPINLTEFIHNADFSRGLQEWNAQTTSLEGYTNVWAVNSASPYATEAYAGFGQLEMTGYKLWQSVTLSPGMYRFRGNAFYRYGSSYLSDVNKGEEISEAFIFAGDELNRVPSEDLPNYANSLDEAAAEFQKGRYKTQIIFTLDQTTTIQLGFQGTHSYLKSWFTAGPCALEKINQQILDDEAEKDFDAKKRKYLLKWNRYAGIASQSLQPEIYEVVHENAKDAIKNATTDEELLQLDNQIWAALKKLITQSTTATGQFDITTLIQNPAFNDGLTGWTIKGAPVRTDNGLVEEFNQVEGGVSQILEDMPAGNYTLKAQAFYRMADFRQSSWNYEDGKDNVTAQLYILPDGATSVSQKVQSINDGARVLPARPTSDVPGAFGRSIPNSANGAGDAFAIGQYWNIVRATTATDGGLTIGITHNGGLTNNWLTYDNFRLYYGAKTIDINLDANEKYELTEDTYANVTLDMTLKAGQLNSLCVPFDVPASTFTEIYTVAGVNYDEEQNKAVAVLIPQTEVKAGRGYFVKVAHDTQLHLDDVLLHAEAPDSVPSIWENAAITGAYGQYTVKSNYTLNEDGELAYKRLRLFQPGYCALVNLPAPLTTKIKASTTVPVEYINYDNIQFTVNIENMQARGLINNNTYTLGSESMVDNYNMAPPANRDHPHTAIIPLPEYTGKATIALSWDAYDPVVVISGQTARDFNIPVGSREVEVRNLYPGQVYLFAVTDEGNRVIAQGQFRTEGQLRMIKTTTGSNIRDLGGWGTTNGGHLKYGLIYRGGEMNGGHVMSQTDIDELKRLGIGAEVDLRSEADINGFTINGSVFGSDAPYYFANQYNFVEDALQGDTIMYRNAFNLILDNISKGNAVLFHCIWGADRTGACAMLLEGLLGVTIDQLYKDYELTSFSIAGARHKDGIDSKLDYIRTFQGTGLQKKFYNYWKDYVHIPAERLDEFIRIMNGCEADGIDTITDDSDHNAVLGAVRDSTAIYNLQGQRLTQPLQSLPPGIYFIGGKKILRR